MQYTTPRVNRLRFNSATGDVLGQVQAIGNDILTGNVTAAINDTINSITSAIKGRAYTTGKYKLAEKYMDYVLGRTDITSNTQVPDTMINPAIDFFTKAFGVPITTVEDLDNLDPHYNTDGNNIADYKKRDPLYAQIPDSQVAQAMKIKYYLPYKEQGGAPTWNFQSAYQQAGISTGSGTVASKIASAVSHPGGILWIILGIIALIIIIIVIVHVSKK